MARKTVLLAAEKSKWSPSRQQGSLESIRDPDAVVVREGLAMPPGSSRALHTCDEGTVGAPLHRCGELGFGGIVQGMRLPLFTLVRTAVSRSFWRRLWRSLSEVVRDGVTDR